MISSLFVEFLPTVEGRLITNRDERDGPGSAAETRLSETGTRVSTLMRRCRHRAGCDVIAVYRESGVCAESRFAQFQSGFRFGKRSERRNLPHARERTNPVLVPLLQDVSEFRPRVSARGQPEADSPMPRLGIAKTRGTRRGHD